MSDDGYLSDIDFEESPELLDMSGKEFRFIRRQLNIPQHQAIIKSGDVYLSADTIYRLESQPKVNPSAIREFLLNKPVGLIMALRNQFKEIEENENAQ